MWLLLVELLPEFFSLFKDLKKQGKKHTILILISILALFVVIYHDIYLYLSIPSILIFSIIVIIHCLSTRKNSDKSFVCIQLNQEIPCINKKIPITYKQIFDSKHEFIVQDKIVNFILLAKYGGNYLTINQQRIDSLPLSPIFHYGIIFYQKVIDIHGDIFDIKVMLSGFFSPALTISIEKTS